MQSTLEVFYQQANGDYADVMARLRTEERIARFVHMFMADATYARLVAAVDEGDLEGCFMATHTLKGMAADIGFMALSRAASEACEAYRMGDVAKGAQLMGPLGQAYEQVEEAYSNSFGLV